MGRPLRFESANTLYHAFARGNERRDVFRDDRDREHFLDLLGLLAERLGIGREELDALRRPRRHVLRPMRDVLIHLIWRSGDWRLREVGEHFGVGPTGVAVAARRGEAHLKSDRRLAERVRAE